MQARQTLSHQPQADAAVRALREAIVTKLAYALGTTPETATDREWYTAVALAARPRGFVGGLLGTLAFELALAVIPLALARRRGISLRALGFVRPASWWSAFGIWLALADPSWAPTLMSILMPCC